MRITPFYYGLSLEQGINPVRMLTYCYIVTIQRINMGMFLSKTMVGIYFNLFNFVFSTFSPEYLMLDVLVTS
jgi:hypothetical protein